jgi:hypothetical protein
MSFFLFNEGFSRQMRWQLKAKKNHFSRDERNKKCKQFFVQFNSHLSEMCEDDLWFMQKNMFSI